MSDFDLAPPSKVVDGLTAVPMDIQSVDATLSFDGAAQTGEGDATIEYVVGPSPGNPTFDLRQTITQAWLDGSPFPPDKLAHHAFGSLPFTDLRVIEDVQPPGSAHTLRVRYDLALPNSQNGGQYPPALSWAAGPRLTFAFGLSDLNRARYAETWIPANLIWDQFTITLDVQVLNTAVAHSLIANGTVTSLGANRWRIECPSRFTALSPLLEVRASDTLLEETGNVSLSSGSVAIEAWAPAGSGVDLNARIADLQGFLAANDSQYGPYLHANRFTVFFNHPTGMEYEGATVVADDAFILNHETFHSWFARGVKPASQADGWWDEGFTVFHDEGANDAVALDYSDPPAVLCSRDPWQRHTAGASYGDGSAVFMGLAALLSVSQLRQLMSQLYSEYKGRPVSTAMLEAFLVSRSGNPQVVDAFHRFVYGLGDSKPAPDVWMRDNAGDTGAGGSQGVFWNSPDLWVRNFDDGGLGHQSPEHGQDNWLYARVRNAPGAGTAEHFVTTFHTRGFLGTEFVYPEDWLPSMTAAAGFDLAADGSAIVKARWPRELVPPAGTHTCLLAAVLARGDKPVSGRHVWEDDGLAQKNLEVVDLIAGQAEMIAVHVGSGRAPRARKVQLELWRGRRAADLEVALIDPGPRLFRALAAEVKQAHAGGPRRPGSISRAVLEAAAARGTGRAFDPDGRGLSVMVPAGSRRLVGIRLAAAKRAGPGARGALHLVQRDPATRAVVGGVALTVAVRAR